MIKNKIILNLTREEIYKLAWAVQWFYKQAEWESIPEKDLKEFKKLKTITERMSEVYPRK